MRGDMVLAGVAVVAVAGLAWWIYKKGPGGVAQAVTRGAIDAGAGVVKGAASAAGIPDTDAAKCQAALAAGDYWNASFYCPAGTFIGAGMNAIAHAVGGTGTPNAYQPTME